MSRSRSVPNIADAFVRAVTEGTTRAVAQAITGQLAGLRNDLRDLTEAIESTCTRRDVLDRKGAAAYLGVHPKTLDEYLADGLIRSAKFGGRIRIKRQWIDDALESHAVYAEPTRATEIIEKLKTG